MKSTVSDFFTSKLTLVILILAGLFLFAPDQAQAQSHQVAEDFNTAPAGITYVTPATAITRLEAESESLKAILEVLNPSSSDYKKAFAKYTFYAAILDGLYAGKGTKDSLEGGLLVLGTDAVGDLSRTDRMLYRQEAIDLLKI